MFSEFEMRVDGSGVGRNCSAYFGGIRTVDTFRGSGQTGRVGCGSAIAADTEDDTVKRPGSLICRSPSSKRRFRDR